MSSKSIKVIDNYLSKEEADRVENDMIHPMFPWYYHNIITHWDHEMKDPKKHFQFVHSFFFENEITSKYYLIIKPIVEKLEVKSLIRVKANCITLTDERVLHGFHTDYDDNVTSIYYVNDNDGYTEFETGEKIESVKNRMVIFDSNIKHRGTSQTDKQVRVNINFNYYPKDWKGTYGS